MPLAPKEIVRCSVSLAAQLGIATSDLADAQAAAAYTEGERDAVTAARDSAERVVTDLRGELAAAAEELVGAEEQLVAALVAAALAATDSLTTYRFELDEDFENGTWLVVFGVVVGPDSHVSLDFSGLVGKNLRVDGRGFSQSSDGSWIETVEPARLRASSADPVGALWRSLQTFLVVEGDAAAGTYVLACPDDLSTLDDDFAWICDGGAASQIEITLDPTLTFVSGFYAEGEIPTSPGVTRRGSMTITVEVGGEPFVVELPEVIDLSGIECLGDSLGAPGASALELGVLIDTNTTQENNLLFTGCGYTVFPPGVDFAAG